MSLPQRRGGHNGKPGHRQARPKTTQPRAPCTRGCVCEPERGYFFLEPFFSPAAGAGAAPAAAASPSAGFSSSLAFLAFLMTTLWTLTLGSPNGLRPSCQRSSSLSVLMRSPRVSTLRARCSESLRRRLLSMDMAFPLQRTGDYFPHGPAHDKSR